MLDVKYYTVPKQNYEIHEKYMYNHSSNKFYTYFKYPQHESLKNAIQSLLKNDYMQIIIIKGTRKSQNTLELFNFDLTYEIECVYNYSREDFKKILLIC